MGEFGIVSDLLKGAHEDAPFWGPYAYTGCFVEW